MISIAKKLANLTICATITLTAQIAEAGNASATYYADYFQGRRMANGKIFSQHKMTAAHPSLPFGTRLKVVYKQRSVIVTITDRCRCSLDLSKAAFKQLAPLRKGRLSVRVNKI